MIQNLKQHFWKRCHKEYLHECQRRHKWATSSGPQVGVGQLVVIREDSSPPMQWPMGRIIEVHPGKDGIVGAATLRLGQGTIRRSVTKLCVLPLDSNQ